MMANNLLGLDIGEKRVGVARVSLPARLPQTLATLNNDYTFLDNLKNIIKEHQIDALVVGLPRNLNGQETDQTAFVYDFCNKYLQALNLPIIMQDETLSSRVAEDRLKGQKYQKADIDALAATVILEDYLQRV